MKYLNSIVIFIAFCFSMHLTSCKKILDEKQSTAIASPTSISDLQAILDNSSVMNLSRTPSIPECSSDDYFTDPNIYNGGSTIFQNVYLWRKNNFPFGTDWSLNYEPIYNTNLCLEQIEKVDRSNVNSQSWDNVKGSSLFFRAYYFLQLTWEYGRTYDDTESLNDLGIALRLGSDQNVPSVRANVKTCYDQIISDAKESLKYLPDNPTHIFRPSKTAGYGLLARTYLSMRQYDSASKYSNLYLQLKSEILDYNPPTTDPTQYYPFIMDANNEIAFYTEMNQTMGNVLEGLAFADTSLFASYEPNDLRAIAYYDPNGNYQQFQGSYSGSSYYFTGIATDEILLIRAECYARANNKDLALIDLNNLLAKRYDATFAPIATTDATAALERILLERRKELVFRGLRWQDIKRLNKEGKNIVLTRVMNGQTYSLPPNDNRYAILIPQEIIDLTNMPQNPGW